MKTEQLRITPYKGHLERGPDRIYKGPAIRLDLAGYGGAVELGWEGNTMAECPDDYAEFIVRACNSHEALVEALASLLDCATKQLDQSATHGGLTNCDMLAKARAALDAAKQ